MPLLRRALMGLAVLGLGPLAAAAPSVALPAGFEVHPFVSGLHTNTSMAWLPDGRMLCNELAVVSFPLGTSVGRIRIVEPSGALVPEPLYETPADAGNGLSGIALDPEFASNGFLYAFVATPGNVSHEIRRLHVDLATDTVDDVTTVISLAAPAPVSSWHGQSNMQFGPDGLLCVNLGDGAYETASPELSNPPPQDVTSFHGKVFRLDVDQPLPLDASTAEPHLVARGFRNPFGLAVHPTLGTIWVTENGPLTNDELDLVVQGGNFGWPMVTGVSGSPDLVDPQQTYYQVIAPVDATFCTGSLFPAVYQGNLFFGDFLRGALHRVVLSGAMLDTYVSEELWFDNRPFGHLTSLAEGPDGALHFGAQVVPYSTDADTTIYRLSYVTEPTGLVLE